MRRGNAVAKSLHGEFVSGNYFATLGLGAYAGRVLGEATTLPRPPGDDDQLPSMAD